MADCSYGTQRPKSSSKQGGRLVGVIGHVSPHQSALAIAQVKTGAPGLAHEGLPTAYPGRCWRRVCRRDLTAAVRRPALRRTDAGPSGP